MRAKKRVVLTATVALLAGGFAVATLPAASATDMNVTVDCVTGDLSNNSELVARPGDTITINGERCQWPNTNPAFNFLFDSYPLTIDAAHRWVVSPATPAGTYGGPSGDDFVLFVVNGEDLRCGVDNYWCGEAFFLSIQTPRNPPTSTSPQPELTIVSQSKANSVSDRFMRNQGSPTLKNSPRVSAVINEPVALVMPGFDPGSTYLTKIKINRTYVDLGIVSAGPTGQVALPVFAMKTEGRFTIAVIEPRTGATRYVKVDVTQR